MLYIVNDDKPGFIGRIGTLLGSHGINIGTFNLGRREPGGEAVLLLSLDEALTPEVVAEAARLEGVKLVKALSF
jgi:D-3-phosphoglycerate dehydrogenase